MSNYSLITIPIAALFISQTIKLLTDNIKGNFTWHHLIHDYGGMPSSHSALLSALATEMALFFGVNTPIFAATFVFSLIIIRDAVGLRNFIGKADQEINKLNPAAKLREKIGHKPIEIFAGCLLGFIIALIGYLLTI